MIISIRFGNNNEILCNAKCLNVNLLNYVKLKAMKDDNSQVVLDLSDQTGIIQCLDQKASEYASDLLKSKQTYIVVKKTPHPQPKENAGVQKTSAELREPLIIESLLDNFEELYPGVKLRSGLLEQPTLKNASASKLSSTAAVKKNKKK